MEQETVVQFCRRCATAKEDSDFTWGNKIHTRRDTICRECRATARRLAHKPRCSIKPATYPWAIGQQKTHHEHLTDTELAYLAGLIDGEGCIWTSYPARATVPLKLSVTMIHRPTITWIADKCGGLMWAHRTRQPGARQAWCWQTSGIRAGSLLNRLLPFMVTKHSEAEAALRIWGTFWNDQRKGRLTEETKLIRAAAAARLHELKREEWPAA